MVLRLNTVTTAQRLMTKAWLMHVDGVHVGALFLLAAAPEVRLYEV